MFGHLPTLDPYYVARPRMFPLAKQCLQTTQDYGRSSPMHTHRGYVDSDGNGNTDIVSGHFHRVIGGRVMPSPVDSHDHQLVYVACGAGSGF